MSSSVHNLTHQYAVISVGGKTRPERLVVAYSEEQTLRDLLAAPSILSLGYCSRKEAMASIDECTPTGHASPRNLTAASVDMVKRSLEQSGALCRRSFDLAKPRDFIRGVLQHSFIAAIAFCYSKNLLSVAIRALISC